MSISLPASVVLHVYSIVLTPHYHESCISIDFKYSKSHIYAMSGGYFQCLQNYPGAYFGDFQYYKGRKCNFCDSRELKGC